MRIGIDARPFQAQFAGTRRYALELCRALDVCLPQAEFFVYGNRPFDLPVRNERWHRVSDHSPLYARLPPTIWFAERVGSLLKRDSIDVFWGGANFLPRDFRSRAGHCKSLLTVLDLVPELFPETMGLKHRLAYSLYFRNSLNNADRLITISQGSKDRLFQTYGKQADAVIYPCASQHFRMPSLEEVRRVRGVYGLHEPFFLAVATLEPRKNLDSLIEAMARLKTERQIEMPDLVLVGQMGWKTKKLMQVIEYAKSCAVRIVQLGFVPDEDLPGLYGAAKAFIFPSRYEGFGIPVLEALKCGAHVLASDTPEIREAGGQQASYFEPTVAGIKAVLQQTLQPNDLGSSGVLSVAHSVDLGSTWAKEGQKLAQMIRSLL
ncbi:glycosyltransferase family 4 protein [Orrella daihaiensis]|uniref:Glycosyltransferase family 4 protein n=1 Tax=Orrella daihaiensis TaxID=2782176 RepID=A0ABY4AI22_9BURK|nr:glycosyltransferase family 1 protein [Orrella daihaiensis]UOD49733.1 glycosyltransferase family 4 protein [Orrella daihaiensis]